MNGHDSSEAGVPVDAVRWELTAGRVPGTPWCVACNDRADQGGHKDCPAELDGWLWTPCRSCLGGGVDLGGGRSCPDCMGIGFWQAGSEAALVGGYTAIAQAALAERTAEAAMRQAVRHDD